MQEQNILIEIVKYLDNHQGLLTVLGWGIIVWAGLHANKVQLRNSARLEIYKELYQLKLDIDKISIELSLLLWSHALPFMYMEWAEKGSSSVNGKSPAEIWIEHNKQIIEANHKFSEAYSKFWNANTAWNSIMPELKTSRNILFNELSKISSEISQYVNYHREQMMKHNWKEWDRSAIEKEADKVYEKFLKISNGFLNDYMDDVHDELIHPIFNVKRTRREEFNYKKPIEAETLTKDGIKMIRYEATEIAKLRKQ